MHQHHDGADGAAGLEDKDPAAVEEKEDGEAELNAVTERADVVDPVVQSLPQPVLDIKVPIENMMPGYHGSVTSALCLPVR